MRTLRISSRTTAVRARRRRGTRQTSGNLRLSCSPCRGRNRSSIPESGCVARCTSCRESVSGMWRWRSSGPSLLFYASGETREGEACTCHNQPSRCFSRRKVHPIGRCVVVVVESAAVVPCETPVWRSQPRLCIFFAHAVCRLLARSCTQKQAFLHFLCIGFFVIAAFSHPPK